MSGASDGIGSVWPVVQERFERHAPAGVMARVALEHALPAGWADEAFELLFSTVVELTALACLGLRPSFAAARQMPTLPVSLASLYGKVNHTEPAILRALVRGSAGRPERVLHSEMASLGRPRAALLGFAVSALAYNAPALLACCVEQAHQQQEPPPEASTDHLALQSQRQRPGPAHRRAARMLAVLARGRP